MKRLRTPRRVRLRLLNRTIFLFSFGLFILGFRFSSELFRLRGDDELVTFDRHPLNPAQIDPRLLTPLVGIVANYLAEIPVHAGENVVGHIVVAAARGIDVDLELAIFITAGETDDAVEPPAFL